MNTQYINEQLQKLEKEIQQVKKLAAANCYWINELLKELKPELYTKEEEAIKETETK